MTQEDFARDIHVSVATINRWENGRSKPNLSAMRNIREFCEKHGFEYSIVEAEWLSFESNSSERGV